ncbi:MAG: SIS domain-containing protein [Gammaproteobacteria bacterium]|jgi:uncharacterized phosphosugar-binding protein
MTNIDTYIEIVEKLLARLKGAEKPNIEKAAQVIAAAMQNNKWLYVFGSGHSSMMAEEFFYRAGGLVRVYPMFEPALLVHQGATNSTAAERQSGAAKKILDNYPIAIGDVLVIASNSGRNAVPIEMAIEAKKIGVKIIALTSLNHSKSVTSRHSSGKRLFELADIVIDNGGVVGDAAVAVNGEKVAPTSTVINTAIVNAIVARVAELLGDKAEFFASSNTDEGEKRNQKYIEKYKDFVSCL